MCMYHVIILFENENKLSMNQAGMNEFWTATLWTQRWNPLLETKDKQKTFSEDKQGQEEVGQTEQQFAKK